MTCMVFVITCPFVFHFALIFIRVYPTWITIPKSFIFLTFEEIKITIAGPKEGRIQIGRNASPISTNTPRVSLNQFSVVHSPIQVTLCIMKTKLVSLFLISEQQIEQPDLSKGSSKGDHWNEKLSWVYLIGKTPLTPYPYQHIYACIIIAQQTKTHFPPASAKFCSTAGKR